METSKDLAEFYRIFMRESVEGIWRADLETSLPTSAPLEQQMEHLFRYAYLAGCNDAFAQMYGYGGSSEIIGARFPDLFDRTNSDNLVNLRRFLGNGYQIRDAETAEKDKDGGIRFFLNNAVGIVEDQALVRVWGVQRDVTELKLREHERIEFYKQLSPRQRLVFQMIAEGKSTKEIAQELNIGLKTVETHRARLMERLGLDDIPALVRRAVRLGLVSDE